MSYENVYDRMFITLDNGNIVPLVLSGSSNCTQYRNGREVLERNWGILAPTCNKLSFTKGELLNAVKTWGTEGSEAFKTHGKWVTFGPSLYKWYENSLTAAISLEKIIELNHGEHLNCELVVYENPAEFKHANVLIKSCFTSAELEEWIKEAEEYISKNPGCIYPSVKFWSWEPMKKLSNIKGAVIVKSGHNYLESYTYEKSLSFGKKEDAIIFESVEDAYSKIGYCWQNIRFVSAVTKEIQKNFVIAVTPQYSGAGFILKRTSKRILMCYKPENAQLRFKTEKEAQKYIDEKLVDYTADFEVYKQ